MNGSIEPAHLEVRTFRTAIVDDAGQLVLYKDYKDVEFFEISRQIFPKFSTTVKVDF